MTCCDRVPWLATALIIVLGFARGLSATPVSARLRHASIARRLFVIIASAGVSTEAGLAGAQECVWVANRSSDSVALIETATNTVVKTILLPPILGCDIEQVPPRIGPTNIAVTPDGRRVYVTTEACIVFVIDALARDVARAIVFGSFQAPGAVAVMPDGRSAYVTDPAGNNVGVVERQTDRVSSTILVQERPFDIALTHDGRRAYVATHPASVVDTGLREVVDTLSAGDFPWRVAVASDDSEVLVSTRLSGSDADALLGVGAVLVVETSTNSVVAAVPIEGSLEPPSSIAIGPANSVAYIANAESNEIRLLDLTTNALGTVIPVATGVNRVAIARSGLLYATGNEAIAVVKTASETVSETITLTECGRVNCAPPFYYCDPKAPCAPEGIAIGPCPARGCAGDCNDDGVVEVNELVTAVNIALGTGRLTACAEADANGDGHVTVEELIGAVNAALTGCH